MAPKAKPKARAKAGAGSTWIVPTKTWEISPDMDVEAIGNLKNSKKEGNVSR